TIRISGEKGDAMRIPVALVLVLVMVCTAAAQKMDSPSPRPVFRLLSPVVEDGQPRELPPPPTDAAQKMPAVTPPSAEPAPVPASLATTPIDLGAKSSPAKKMPAATPTSGADPTTTPAPLAITPIDLGVKNGPARKVPATLTSGAESTSTASSLAATHIDLGAKCPAPEEPCPECFCLCGVPSRWTVRADFGDGVGYTRGFTYLEGFVPFDQPDASSVVFGDGRVVNFFDDDRWEFNLGAGYRKHIESSDVVLGANLFYDGRHTDSHFFHQIGIGAEALFDRWEFRCNGYIIVGPAHKLTAQSEVASLVGNQLIIERLQTRDVAMGGIDAEVGGLLPILTRLSPRVFAGFYHYSAEGMPSVNGVRGRFEAWLTQN